MDLNKNAVERFLHNTDMHPDAVELASTVDHMLKEMSLGLKGEPSSLAMMPTYIGVNARIPAQQRAVALDAGGTHLRAALVSFSDDGAPLIEDFTRRPMPGAGGHRVDREEFFDTLAALIQPLTNRGEKIGFCFSYATEILPNRDGRVIYLSKEIQAPEVEGRLIGADLREALKARGMADPPSPVVLNDTVATLLAGRACESRREWGGYVGFILGTGANTCYVESHAAISKLKSPHPLPSQIINIEAGNFAGARRGEGDRRLDASTARPAAYRLEKMLSGAYFGALVAHTVALAQEQGLLSFDAADGAALVADISTRDANNYCRNPLNASENALAAKMKATSDADSARLWFLIDALLERAAKLSAANLAASVLKGHSAAGPLKPTCIAIDGTAYYRYHRFPHRVEQHLRPFLTRRNRYYETLHVDDAPLIGAAVAALTN